MPIALCKRHVPSSSLLDAEESSRMWNLLCEACGVSQRRILGCMPVSVGRRDLPGVRGGPYLATLKADGVRFFLFLTTRPGQPSSPVCLMIDRKRTMYEIHVSAPRSYFEAGSVFEGELVWRQPEQDGMCFYIFDCLRCRGTLFTDRPFRERLDEVRRCLSASEARGIDAKDAEMLCEQVSPRIHFQAKQFVDLAFSATLWHKRINADFYADGLVLCHSGMPYVHGRGGESMLKWKEWPTVDLFYVQGGGVASNEGGAVCRAEGLPIRIERNDILCPGSLTEFYVKHVPACADSGSHAHVLLVPCRRRDDKSHANSASVVFATVRDVIEAVSPEELAGEVQDSSADGGMCVDE